MSASGSKSAVVLELAEEFLQRYRQGERPSLQEYTERHPDLADEIREVFPAMALMEHIALADESLASPSVAAQTPALTQLGDFRILREIGRGGMGIVYEAEQVSLGRHVALKVLPNKALLDERHQRRFEREARAAARLHHTNVVPVFGVGEHEGVPYYVMQFIHGRGLHEVLMELRRLQGHATPPDGKLPVARHEVAAADVARSLVHGTFHLDADAAPTSRRPHAATQALPWYCRAGAASPARPGNNHTGTASLTSACRSPAPCTTPINRASCTATSSRPTCSWTRTAPSGSPILAWPRRQTTRT
jgi:hypothetical protein